MKINKIKQIIIQTILLLCISFTAQAGGFLGIDHQLTRADTGIWSRNNQLFLEYGSAVIVLGESLWLGSDTRLGKTFWKSTDSMIMTAVGSAATKEVFRRERPNQANDPNAWFKSSTDRSFPSGEVAHITAIITPFIAEYKNDNPYVWSLAAFPIYDGIARMKSQAHWQTDVLAGAALGAGIGLYNSSRDTPFSVAVLPNAITIGFNKKF
jgi:undecaprenyl-diphosphatase